MKIAELRTIMNDAFLRVGLSEQKLFTKGTKVWCLPGGELIRFFQPQPYRRSWGFVFTGYVGIEIPSLRSWLASHSSGDPGIFHHSFVAHHTLNDADSAEFMTELEQQVPTDHWAAAIRAKLESIPSSLDDLVAVYRDNPAALGGLQRPIFPEAWPFLLRWMEAPQTIEKIPHIGADGRVAE